MLAGNTRNYGGLMNLTHRAQMDDGLLDVALMRKGGLHLVVDGVLALFGVTSGRRTSCTGVPER